MRLRALTNFMSGLLLATSACALSACNDDGPFEEAGEKVDDAIDDAGDAVEDLGDEIDDATDPNSTGGA